MWSRVFWVSVAWLVIVLLEIRFTDEITLGELISIVIASAVVLPAVLFWVCRSLSNWRQNHAYLLRTWDDGRPDSIVLARSAKVNLGQQALAIEAKALSTGAVLERWFWFEDRKRRMLHFGLANFEWVSDLNSTEFHNLYDPKPPEIEMGEPQGVGYRLVEDDRRGKKLEFITQVQIKAPFDGWLVMKCIDAGGAMSFGRMRITAS